MSTVAQRNGAVNHAGPSAGAKHAAARFEHADPVTLPLALPGWVAYNCERWKLRSETYNFTLPGSDLPSLSCVLYRNHAGHYVNPPLNPYIPLALSTTPTTSCTRRSRQWLDLAELLASKLLKAGLGNTLPLQPGLTDARPFQWAGLHEGLRYSYILALPLDMLETEHDARKNIAKAKRAGYSCRIADDPRDVLECLKAAEQRQGFHHWLRREDLLELCQLLEPRHLSMVTCYAPNGEPASARIVLHTPGTTAVDWVGGTKVEHLHNGATQLSLLFAMEHVYSMGAVAYDFAGANIAHVADAKSKWRGELVPYLTLQQYGLRSLARFLLNWRKANSIRRAHS